MTTSPKITGRTLWFAAVPPHGSLCGMPKIQTQGLHHITLVGADRQTSSIDRAHLADGIEALVARSRDSLSDDRSPKAASDGS